MEPLSGAASVISVASLAIEVCKELKSVHDFWHSVKEAPGDIARISTEVNLLITMLTMIAHNYQRHSSDQRLPSEVAATETLKLCLATVGDMNAEIKDLESGISKGSLSRRRASMKFVFQKDTKEKSMAQIERVKSLLIIVQTFYVAEVQEARFRALCMSLRPQDSALDIKYFPDTVTTTSANKDLGMDLRPPAPIPSSSIESMSSDPTVLSRAAHRPKHRITQQGSGLYRFGLAMLRLFTIEQESTIVEDSGNERRIASRRTRYEICTARWLLSCGFAWESSVIYGSWKHTFRTFRYIPRDARIVYFCIKGDVENVQRMFDKGLASPFDRVCMDKYKTDNYGDWSLLHFSVASCHSQLCRFLIDCGLGHGTASGMSRSPILCLAGMLYEDEMIDPDTHLDILRIMIYEGQYDPMEESVYRSVMYGFHGSPKVYRWLLDQETFLLDLEEIILELIFSQQSSASHWLEMLLARINKMNGPVRGQILDWKLRFHVAWSLNRVADNLDYPKRIKALLDAGADLYAPIDCKNKSKTLEVLIASALLRISESRWENKKTAIDREEQLSVPNPTIPMINVTEYDRFEDTTPLKDRSRTSKSLWRSWFPGNELSLIEVIQRVLDAWMEVLLEAGIDIGEYGQREEQQMRSGGLLLTKWPALHVQARMCFEYGEHVNGCRIHVTEIWVWDLDIDPDSDEDATSAETTAMPGSWDFDDK